ncbi:hypothetical protein BKA00_005480 [Actinomadura coerulea]|uniref:Uncharacterized protein n=1 Tax=Actinomadura coerulea TaxID=46159 RepID=A0A7X0L1E2_9ACTN|nr:hypothetical protein [Actinomadura coerulea]MBB6398566.1 hypothetical protein [Actinomadura coerulea]
MSRFFQNGAVAVAHSVGEPVAAARELAGDPDVRRLADLAHEYAAAMPR